MERELVVSGRTNRLELKTKRRISRGLQRMITREQNGMAGLFERIAKRDLSRPETFFLGYTTRSCRTHMLSGPCKGALSGTQGQGPEKKAAQRSTKTTERPTARGRGPKCRFRYQFFFVWRRLWPSYRQKHAAAHCLLFRTLDLGLKKYGTPPKSCREAAGVGAVLHLMTKNPRE